MLAPLRRARVLTTLSLALLAGLLPSSLTAETGQAPSLADRKLVVGATSDNYPYSYVNGNGQVSGFAVDLLDAVARAMHLKITRVTAPGASLQARFQNGDYDFLQVYSQSPEREAFAEFSVPFLTLQGCLFVRDSGRSTAVLPDLTGKTFAVLGTGSTGLQFLRDHHLNPRIIYVGSAEQALGLVHSGDVAATFLSRLTALSIINRNGFHDVVIAGEPLDNYDVRHSYAVHRGDAQLLARLNEGLAIVHRTGEYDELYRKWFGRIDSPLFTREQVVRYVATVLGLALMVTLLGFLRQRSLRQSLARQTQQLNDQRALLQALYDNIPTAMCVIERAGTDVRLISMNRQAGSLYAVDPTYAAGRLLSELPLSVDAMAHLAAVAKKWPEPGQILHDELRFEGNRRILSITTVALSGAKLGHERVCVLAEDITNRRQMDEEIAQSRKLRAVGELVGGIAHEFNNLLTPVMLKVDEIKLDWPHDTPLQQSIHVISQAVQRTADLTRRLLTFGRKSEPRAESVRLEAVVDSCFELLSHTIDRRIVWESAIPSGLPPLHFNTTDLNQILLNLMLNSRDTLLEKLNKAHPADWVPKIHLEVVPLPAHAVAPASKTAARTITGWQRLTVRDNGYGMPAAIVERIFEPFFTTKEVGKGTGLGLATVWHLVAAAGGRVEVESIPGEGSAFHIYLPVTPVSAPPRAAVVAPKALSGLRVLLVEDEPLVAQTITLLLKRNSHTVHHVADGLEAWRHLEQNLAAYDLLLIDVNLPGLSGVDIVTRVREKAFEGRILIMSGRFETADLRALARLKIDHAVTKPFTAVQFDAAIRECLTVREPTSVQP